jgi:hypothetical protein
VQLNGTLLRGVPGTEKVPVTDEPMAIPVLISVPLTTENAPVAEIEPVQANTTDPSSTLPLQVEKFPLGVVKTAVHFSSTSAVAPHV